MSEMLAVVSMCVCHIGQLEGQAVQDRVQIEIFGLCYQGVCRPVRSSSQYSFELCDKSKVSSYSRAVVVVAIV